MDFTSYFNALFARGGTPYVMPGIYVCNGQLDIDGVHNLTLDLPGVTFAKTVRPKGRAGVHLLRVRLTYNLKLARFRLRGPKIETDGYLPAFEGQHGIGLHATLATIIDAVDVEHVPGDGVYLASMGGRREVTPPRATQILNSRFYDLGRHGVGATAYDGLLIRGNRFEKFHRQWFDHSDRQHPADPHLNETARRDENVIIPA